MCGICGILRSGPLEHGFHSDLLRGMQDRLAHRGPDQRDHLITERVALGHTRLAIIDIEGGAQPMSSPDGRFALVFNGEIYNYVELRQMLSQRGVRFRTFSDTEVLLHLLMAEGEAALQRLNGMFAFCFVNLETGEWLLGRDHFGIKPLYIATLDNEVLFASEIKALLAHPKLRAELNWDGLEEYLTFQFCLDDRTLFKRITKVEPGTLVRGARGEIRQIRRWWSLDFETDEHHTEQFFIDRLRSLVEESVHMQMRSDVPVGAYLSGGIDSSLVALLASQTSSGILPAFHGRFVEGPAYDESAYAQSVAQTGNIELHIAEPGAEDFVRVMPSLIYALDEPAAGPGLFPQYMVSTFAREHVTVTLGGQGGDELFCGYTRYLLGYLEQALKGAIFRTAEEDRHIVTLSSIIDNLPSLQGYTPLMRHFWSEGLFEPMDRRYYWLINRMPHKSGVFSADVLDRLDQDGIYQRFESVFNRPDTRSYINKMQAFDLSSFLPALLQVEDRVSMAVSLESRVPLLDYRVAELVASIPPAIKFRGGATKYLLKEAFRVKLPQNVVDRKDKMGFPVPLDVWMQHGIVREFVSDILTDQRTRERGILSPELIESLGHVDLVSSRQVWGALCLELWFRSFIDEPSH